MISWHRQHSYKQPTIGSSPRSSALHPSPSPSALKPPCHHSALPVQPTSLSEQDLRVLESTWFSKYLKMVKKEKTVDQNPKFWTSGSSFPPTKRRCRSRCCTKDMHTGSAHDHRQSFHAATCHLTVDRINIITSNIAS